MQLPTRLRIVDHGEKSRVLCFGGVYGNLHALVAMLERAATTFPPTDVYCLGDHTGPYGLEPERILATLESSGVHLLQGNVDYTVAHGEDECGCGYTSPRDNHFAKLSFDFARRDLGTARKRWLAELPQQFTFRLDGRRVRLCHGSPRVMNEFLWESRPDSFYRPLLEQSDADVVVCTHTGLPWTREVAPGQWIVNCGVIGRPANDGTQDVWYAELDARGPPQLRRLAYDWRACAAEMSEARRPAEFVSSIVDGWWGCCTDVLPAVEAGRRSSCDVRRNAKPQSKSLEERW